MTNTQYDILADLMKELSTELDLHYEESQASDLAPTLAKLDAAAQLLETAGHPLPEAYLHVRTRFGQSRH